MSSGIWAPFKELASVVNQAILKRQSDAFYNLEAILKKHKTDFISLLKNPVSLSNAEIVSCKHSSNNSLVEACSVMIMARLQAHCYMYV